MTPGIVSRQLKLSSNFFVGPVVAHHSGFLIPGAGTQFQGETLHRGRKIPGVGKFSTEIAVYLGTKRYEIRPWLLWSVNRKS